MNELTTLLVIVAIAAASNGIGYYLGYKGRHHDDVIEMRYMADYLVTLEKGYAELQRQIKEDPQRAWINVGVNSAVTEFDQLATTIRARYDTEEP